jgi:hypothetical protein
MIKRNIFFLFIVFTTAFFSCNEEEQITALYIGLWHTSIYTTTIDEQGSLVNRRLILDFTADSVSGIINHVIGHIEYPLCGISGSIDQPGENSLSISLNRMGSYAGLNVEWHDSGTAEYDSLYNLNVEDLLPVEFEANFLIEGDHMDIIIPLTGDTIQLTR